MLVKEHPEASQGDSHILHPGSRILFRYWDKTRAAAAAPRRDAIDLKHIREIVPHLVIIERGLGGSYRWRLAGTGACDIFRREITGRPVLEGWERFERDVIERFLNGVAEELQPCVLRFRFHTDHNELIGAELIAMPVEAANGQIHILGGLFAFRDLYGLSHTGIAAMELSGARGIWREHLTGDALVKGMSHDPQPKTFRPFQVIAGGRA